jgi:hypothetical protein
MSGAILPLSQYAFMAWCSVKKKSTGITLPFYLYLEIFEGNGYTEFEMNLFKRNVSPRNAVKCSPLRKVWWMEDLSRADPRGHSIIIIEPVTEFNETQSLDDVH